MSNDVHHSVVLQALGWKTLEAKRKKAKAKMMYNLILLFVSPSEIA